MFVTCILHRSSISRFEAASRVWHTLEEPYPPSRCCSDIAMVGYEIATTDTAIAAKHLCAKCRLIVKDAVQTACGHRYCSPCISPLLSRGPIQCDVCGSTITKPETFRDKFADREILELHVHCVNQPHGCPWEGELRHRQNHHTKCEFTPISCVHPECGKKLSVAKLPEHLQNECQYREETCSYCEQPVVVARMKEHHEKTCPSYPVNCPKCSKELIRVELARHLDPASVNACEKLITECPFSKVGCQEVKVMNSKERKVHLEKGVVGHTSLLLALFMELSRYIEESLPRLAMGQPGDSVSKLQELCNKAIMGIDSVVKELAVFKTKQEDHESRIKKLEQRGGGIGVNGLQSLRISENIDNEAIGDVLRRVANVEAKGADHEVLVVEAHSAVDELRREVGRLNVKLQESDDIIRRLERQLELHDQGTGLRNLAIADLEERLNTLQGTTFDSVLLWKITNVANKRSEATSGRVTSFYSPCFFTGPHGYKMCARIYLNGDGMGRNHHVSLFFVIMRGEFDALLRWPFRQKVTLMLLDQDNVEHVIDAFRPDPSSSSFQRPRAEMNIASGCPLFCSHEQLTQHAYIRDDTMFLKIIVDKPDWA
ncbi:TNF receptor-associated factor 3 isoform X3 [Nematostella vectensis]|uniref:TNF receptor-associated factor 3 isoform X3 n=1 Tax=Nematostella vectensis TaxID=45351 RepID=UPI0020772548|nr:TNF receptor-associated factor 3 isoform X3 [Nematostella vectensis]